MSVEILELEKVGTAIWAGPPREIIAAKMIYLIKETYLAAAVFLQDTSCNGVFLQNKLSRTR